jgi:hypothetical protein
VQQIMDFPETPPAARDRIAAAVPPDRLIQFKDTAAHREAWMATGISGWIAAQFHPASQPAPAGSASTPK